ncbi:metallophosphoesterase [Brevibacillus ruminantium]|uniref:Phosphoesterase n=1 Tax=Brevibacillus ruminantium TaxID=2950604 RepID=A0ABY4WAJ9_9BACL|nr:metallophosphoesterase [Brevibacillus ruminantium]USG64175.1 metallophosphoesterase [Brevibacillus ruminantium]
MGILILSDTHGLVGEVKEVVERHKAEAVFHCGDYCVDHTREPFSQMLLVKGNCDFSSDVPTERQTAWKGLNILQTHGHLYNVKNSLLRLHYRAEETGANVVLFGHSHMPGCAVERDILFLNPGSLQLPRGYDLPTYVCLEHLGEKEGKISLQVTYYDHRGEPAPKLGGTFSVRS